MKKIISFILCAFIILILSSCRSNPKPYKEEPAPAKNIEYKEINPGSAQSVPETPPAETPKPEPAEPSTPAPAPKKTEKKPAPKPLESYSLGSYSTVLLNKDKDRTYNIKLGAKKINGYKLNPGDTFSFNDVVGKRNAETGFRTAAIIVNGEYEEGFGGGVCQLSTTIFNAADKAGLQILERHDHSKTVGYVPKGRDAAVNYGSLDLKFKNTKKYPVEIRTSVDDKRVYISIWKTS
ncbi:VanW family protein [Clostridium sp. YIM B02515]|uniref:VanW family protein n=1 Tax=Clostridium rhizosphaerae TaxID=2803861 RepID=A0ABS1TBZ8_9CLOT|nr:VanW family protein [Clostridium rhizosphaerae]MBL4936875.1 VanW family protein [Clostridium rhizosphaerae]